MNGPRTEAQTDALHWAAVALGLKEAREKQGNPLTNEERIHFDGYQNNARQYGITDGQIRTYMNELGRRD